MFLGQFGTRQRNRGLLGSWGGSQDRDPLVSAWALCTLLAPEGGAHTEHHVRAWWAAGDPLPFLFFPRVCGRHHPAFLHTCPNLLWPGCPGQQEGTAPLEETCEYSIVNESGKDKPGANYCLAICVRPAFAIMKPGNLSTINHLKWLSLLNPRKISFVPYCKTILLKILTDVFWA